MRLLVVGATGSLGRLAVAEAAQRGHDVTALVRDPARANLPEPVVKVRGDVLDPVSLGPAVEGRDAVVCALGTPSPRQASSLLEDGTRNLVAAMERASVPRLVCVTLLGTADSKRNASPLYRYIILRALAPMVPDKESQERVVRDSGLEWYSSGRGASPASDADSYACCAQETRDVSGTSPATISPAC
jgi:uncharacterized protein YbjT (DUF2867 family)